MTTALSSQTVPSLPVLNHENAPQNINGHARHDSLEGPSRSAHSESSGELLIMPHDNPNRSLPTTRRSRTSVEPNGSSTQSSGGAVASAGASTRPRALLQRANTDNNGRRRQTTASSESVEENWEMRHGWEDQYTSSEYLGLLSSVSSSPIMSWSIC